MLQMEANKQHDKSSNLAERWKDSAAVCPPGRAAPRSAMMKRREGDYPCAYSSSFYEINRTSINSCFGRKYTTVLTAPAPLRSHYSSKSKEDSGFPTPASALFLSGDHEDALHGEIIRGLHSSTRLQHGTYKKAHNSSLQHRNYPQTKSITHGLPQR